MKRTPLKCKTPFPARQHRVPQVESAMDGAAPNSNRRVRSIRGKKRAKKKQTEADLKRAHGIEPTATLRYTGIKGIAWYWFARFIRQRDFIKWGRCISCNKPCGFDGMQAGHYAPASNCGLDLLMDEANVNGECGGCNAFDEGHLIGYRRNFMARYGQTAIEILDERYQLRHQITTKMSPKEWEAMAIHYKTEYESLLHDLP